MEDIVISKQNPPELMLSKNYINNIEQLKKEKISSKGVKHKSNLNNNHNFYINSKIYSNIISKYKSEKYSTNLIKLYNDIILIKKSLKKHSKEIMTKIKKTSFEEENSKENNQNDNLIIFDVNNYKNMPSYTKELRRALYSNSDIQSFKSMYSNSSSFEGHTSSHQNNNNDSLEQISEEHMHEDNQTLLHVISEKRNSDHLDIDKNENEINYNQYEGKSEQSGNDPKKGNNTNNNNFNYNDLLVIISTTKNEVEKIQSKVEKAKKIKLLNQSYSCTKFINRLNINNSNNSQDNINNYLVKEKNKKYSIDDSLKLLEEKNIGDTKNIENKKTENNNNIETSSYLSMMEQTTLNRPIIMVASSLMKDIRDIYKFKEKPLGGGNFGTVRKAYRREDKGKRQYYAIKSISKKNLNENDFDKLVKEVDIISSLDHPNIIKFYETYHDKFYFHLVMELCKGRDSFNQIVIMEKCEEKKVVSLIAKVLLAIAHCHSRGITHRDLKPENILFENNEPDAEIKIIDFGLSRKYAKDEKMHSVLGTPYYVAPEVLKGNYDEKCDIWSIGAMTYLLLCGHPPFNGTSDKEIFDNILNSNVKFNLPIFNNVSNNAKSFVKLCLEKNPSKRPSAIKALDHPWFTNVLNESHKVQNLRADILLNIKNFKIKQKFKQMIMKYLLNTMDEEELKIYKSAFFAIDFFHNGCVEQPELKKAFELKDIPMTDEEISHLYKILDQNLKGAFDYTEFLMAGVNQKKLFTTEKLQKAFNYFDINKSGFIENTDLYDCLLRMGRECINTNDVNSFIYEVLKNIDDKKGIDKNSEVFTKVSYEDFLKIFQNDQTNNFSPYESSNISNENNL